MIKTYLTIALGITIICLTACGLAEDPPTLPPPTVTRTPISTELPTVAGIVPAGINADNPIQLVIVPPDLEQAQARVEDLQEQVSTLTDIALEVVVVPTQAQAFAMLCAANQGTLAMAWLDGMTYAAAHLQDCGIGVLQAERDGISGERGLLLLDQQYEEGGIAEAASETLCRLSYDNFYSWTLPVIFYATQEIAVLDIANVREVQDNDALIAELQRGQCAAIGMSETNWEGYLAADETLAESVTVNARSPLFPYHVLAAAYAIPLDIITELESMLLQLDQAVGRSDENASDDDATEIPLTVDAELMTIFFGEGSLQVADQSQLDAVEDFLTESGINFAGFNG